MEPNVEQTRVSKLGHIRAENHPPQYGSRDISNLIVPLLMNASDSELFLRGNTHTNPTFYNRGFIPRVPFN